MASLTIICTTWVGLVGSYFNWQNDDQHLRTHSILFFFILHLLSKYSHLIMSKTSLNVDDCSSIIAMTIHCLVRSLRSARWDTAWLVESVKIVWPDWLDWRMWSCVQAFKIQFSSYPTTLELTGMCGVNAILPLIWLSNRFSQHPNQTVVVHNIVGYLHHCHVSEHEIVKSNVIP